MNLLFVTAGFPFPPRRGYLLIAYHHIRQLATKHSVDLISFRNPEADPESSGGLAEWCDRITLVDLPAWQSLMNVGLGVASRRPFQVSHFRSERMQDAVQEALLTRSYDVVVFQLTRMAQYRPPHYNGRTILSMVDPFILNYQRSLSWRPWYMRLALRAEIARLIRYETEMAAKFDRILLISESDVRDYRNILQGAHLDWVPSGVDVRSYEPKPSHQRTPGMIVLTGNMFHAPNVDAVSYFCHDIFPLVREHIPDASLWLVGARPSPAVARWDNQSNIHVTGFVDNVKTYLEQAMVSVCPVRLDVGTQTKILEALAAGTPVVTTSAGNQGVGGTSGTDLYVEDSPTGFAEKVVGLLRGENWLSLSEHGHRFVTDHFSWEASSTKLEFIMDEVVRGP